MGWTFYDKDPDRTAQDEIRGLLEWTSENTVSRVLDMATVKRTIYAAVETTTIATGEKHVWAAVVLISYRRSSDWGNFGYKDMEEGMGPVESECPLRILRLLDEPAPNEWAAQWRERCRANAERTKTVFVVGETYEFPGGLRCAGEHFDRLTVEGKAPGGRSWLCRTPRGTLTKVGPSIMRAGRLVA